VQLLMPTLFLKRTKTYQLENGKFVDFSDTTQVWRRPSKKRLRISANDLYCQKLDSLTYILVDDSIGLCLLLFTQEVEPLSPKLLENRVLHEIAIARQGHSRSFI